MSGEKKPLWTIYSFISVNKSIDEFANHFFNHFFKISRLQTTSIELICTVCVIFCSCDCISNCWIFYELMNPICSKNILNLTLYLNDFYNLTDRLAYDKKPSTIFSVLVPFPSFTFRAASRTNVQTAFWVHETVSMSCFSKSFSIVPNKFPIKPSFSASFESARRVIFRCFLIKWKKRWTLLPDLLPPAKRLNWCWTYDFHRNVVNAPARTTVPVSPTAPALIFIIGF